MQLSSLRVALTCSGLWLAAALLATVAFPVLLASVPQWHEVRVLIERMVQVQTWVAIVACLGLLMASRRKHDSAEQPWAQGPVLVYVLGGLLCAIVLNFGVLPQWLVQPNATSSQLQVIALWGLHAGCAVAAWRALRRYAKAQRTSGTNSQKS